jgi:hypothetical protein
MAILGEAMAEREVLFQEPKVPQQSTDQTGGEGST